MTQQIQRQQQNSFGSFCIAGLLCITALFLMGLPGCEKTKTDAAASAKKINTTPPAQTQPLTDWFPEKTLFYVRIDDMQRAKNEFIQPQYVKNAIAARKAWTTFTTKTVDIMCKSKDSYGIEALTMLQLLGEIKTVHSGWLPPFSEAAVSEKVVAKKVVAKKVVAKKVVAKKIAPQKTGSQNIDAIAILEFSGTSGLNQLRDQLKKKQTMKQCGSATIHLINGPHNIAYYDINETTILVGTERSVTHVLTNRANPHYKSLTQCPEFLQARKELDNQSKKQKQSRRELFAYANLDAARQQQSTKPSTEQNDSSAPSISYVAGTIGVNGGFTLTAFTQQKTTLPTAIVRTPRNNKFLKHFPKETALFVTANFSKEQQARQQFRQHISQHFTADIASLAGLIPQGILQLTDAFLGEMKTAGTTKTITNSQHQSLQILNDIWLGLSPVKSESAIAIAPNQQGEWGIAAIFDINNNDPENRKDIDALKKKIRELAEQKKLTWNTETVHGLTIHSFAIKQLFPKSPPKIQQHLQPRFGYAEQDGRFFIGSTDLLKFAHQPTANTLANKLSYQQIDLKNGMLFSIRPGEILHRTFGIGPVDELLKKLALQIPIDSNYSVTINIADRQATLRSNIPFTSLIGWLALEWLGEGPAQLKPAAAGTKEIK